MTKSYKLPKITMVLQQHSIFLQHSLFEEIIQTEWTELKLQHYYSEGKCNSSISLTHTDTSKKTFSKLMTVHVDIFFQTQSFYVKIAFSK